MSIGPCPRIVSIAAWMIIATSALFFVANLLQILFRLGQPLAWVMFLAGAVYSVARLGVGLAIWKGLNWARILYLASELVVVNAGISQNLPYLDSEMPSGVRLAPWAALVYYAAVVFLLTRKSALAFFGRLARPPMTRGHIVLALVVLSFLSSGLSALAYRLGDRGPSLISDYLNPVNWIRNDLAYYAGLTLLESQSYHDQRMVGEAIKATKSIGEIGEVLSQPVARAQTTLRENNTLVIFLGLISVVAAVLILRHH